MLLAFIKNVFLLLILSFFAYHVEAFSQTVPQPGRENINPLMFLTQDENSIVHLNYIDTGRSMLYSKELGTLSFIPGTLHWSMFGQTRLLTYAQLMNDKKVELRVISISTKPVLNIQSQIMPEILQDTYQFSHAVAKSPNELYATNGSALYYVTIGSRSQSKAILIHKASSTIVQKVDILDFDSSGKNLIFAYNAKTANSKNYFTYNIENKKISSLNAATSCRGKIIHLNDRLIPLGENQFLAYCQATPSTSPAFLFFDFTKLVVTRYETNEVLDVNSKITIDAFGYFVLIKNIKDRLVYCNGNIKERLNIRCLNTATFNNGFIFSAGNVAQFFMISANNIFSIDFSTGISRRTSILFNTPLEGRVLDPISL